MAAMRAERAAPPAALAARGPWPDGAALAWALAIALPLLAALGGAPLFDVDEGAFAEATREMLAGGDFGHTTLNGAPRFDKPILVYWLQAASVSLFGLHPAALRLPSALCTWASALAVAAFAAPRWGRGTAAVAGTVLATALGPLLIGRAATADALLNLCLMLTALDLWRHFESGARAPLRRCAVWVALGLLAKGPVALLIPVAALLLWALSYRDAAALRRALADPVAWALLLALALPWYLYAWQRHGMAFVEGFILRHNVQRFAAPLEGHAGGALYYLLVLPLLWWPWSPLWLRLAAQARALWAEALSRYLLLWAGFVIGFFTLSGTKLPHYSLYAGPALVLLSARALEGAGAALQRGLGLALGVGLLAVAALPWALRAAAPSLSDPLYAALLRDAPAPWALLAGSVAAGTVLAALWAWRGIAFAPRLCAGALVLATLIAALASPWWGEALQGPVLRAALVARALGEPVVQWSVHWPSVAVTLQREAPRREPAPGELAFARADRLPAGVVLQRLYEERGVVLVRRAVVAP
jgi:4-amino-4-deoxy-L-arabinose transferase-like glycosyltransferase